MPEISAIDLSGWERLMNDLARKMHQGKVKPENISRDFVLNTYNELYRGAEKGYGSGWKKFDGDEGRTISSLKKNIFLFSGAKTYAMQKELNELLHEGGKIRPWEEFKKRALELNSRYNKNNLQAEYQTARQTAHHVRNWQQYQKDKDLFPNLKYMTTGDDRVRDSHRQLHGIVKPINDSFWNSFYPPNGWRCRCYVTQTAEPAIKQNHPPDKAQQLGVQKGFEFNAAKTGEIYNRKKHPYFAMAAVSGINLEKEHFRYQQAHTIETLVKGKAEAKNPELDKKVVFNAMGVKEAFNQPHKHYDAKNLIIQHMDKILANAEYLGFTEYPKDNPMIKGSHIFKMQIEKETSFAVVREQQTGELVFYSISESNKVTKGLKK